MQSLVKWSHHTTHTKRRGKQCPKNYATKRGNQEELQELVRRSAEKTLSGLLKQEAQQLTQAAKYERTQERQDYRSGHYKRKRTTTSGDVSLKMPKLKGVLFETAIIERYRRRKSSVEEAFIEM